MPITFLDAVDFTKVPSLAFVVPVVSADPTGYEAGLIYNSTEKMLKFHNGTAWVAAASIAGTPAGGDLSGTYPNPQIAAGVIVDADVAAANKDGVPTTPSLRTLGTGANQAAPGNDARFSDSRPPTGAAGGDLSGTYPNPQILAGAIVDADVAAANKDGAAATPSLRTLGTGANQAAPGNDPRFADARPPTGTAGGDLVGSYPNPQIGAGVIVDADVNAANKDGAAATPSMRTLGMGAAQALAGNTPLNTITAPTAAVSLNSQKITNLADPAVATDGANKNYVDLTAQGLNFKNAARVVSTTNQAALSGLLTIDGVTLVAGDRVLLAGQTTQTQNGIYIAASGAWSRSADADGQGEIKDGTVVPVAEGTANADSLYICTGVGTAPWVPGTNISTWTKFLSMADLQAGAGLTKTGTTIDVVSATADLTVAADSLTVNSAPKWTAARTESLTGDITGSASVDGSANWSLATAIAAGVVVDADVSASAAIAQSKIAGLSTSLTGKVDTTRQVIAGAGLTGGGDLSADRTLNVVAGDATLSVAADAVTVASAPKWTTPRSISLTGDVTGSAATVDGSANVSIATTLVTSGVKRFSQDIGAGTSAIITHNLNTRDLHVAVYRTTTPWDTIQCGVEMTSVNTVTLRFAAAVAASAYRVVVVG